MSPVPPAQVPTQRILVLADDLDIPHAALRMRPKGGHGGHNGLRSIMERMGNTQDFPRIKLGIGRPSSERALAAASVARRPLRAPPA